MLWIAIALSLFTLVMALFRLRLQHGGKTRRKASGAADAHAKAPVPAIPLVTLRYDTLAWIRAFFAQAAFHFRSIVREAPFLAISVICVINLMVNAWYAAHPGESAIWPVTSAIAPVVANSAFVFIVLLATLYGGELVWRERQMKIDQVQDSMPVPVWVTFGGKLLAMFLAIAVLLVITTAT